MDASDDEDTPIGDVVRAAHEAPSPDASDTADSGAPPAPSDSDSEDEVPVRRHTFRGAAANPTADIDDDDDDLLVEDEGTAAELHKPSRLKKGAARGEKERAKSKERTKHDASAHKSRAERDKTAKKAAAKAALKALKVAKAGGGRRSADAAGAAADADDGASDASDAAHANAPSSAERRPNKKRPGAEEESEVSDVVSSEEEEDDEVSEASDEEAASDVDSVWSEEYGVSRSKKRTEEGGKEVGKNRGSRAARVKVVKARKRSALSDDEAEAPPRADAVPTAEGAIDAMEVATTGGGAAAAGAGGAAGVDASGSALAVGAAATAAADDDDDDEDEVLGVAAQAKAAVEAATKARAEREAADLAAAVPLKNKFSNGPRGEINTKMLKHGDFLVVGSIGKISSWKLPYKDRKGRVNVHLLEVARTVVTSGKTLRGKPVDFVIPAAAVKRVEALWAEAKLWHKAYGRALLDRAHTEKEEARIQAANEKRAAKAAEKAKLKAAEAAAERKRQRAEARAEARAMGNELIDDDDDDDEDDAPAAGGAANAMAAADKSADAGAAGATKAVGGPATREAPTGGAEDEEAVWLRGYEEEMQVRACEAPPTTSSRALSPFAVATSPRPAPPQASTQARLAERVGLSRRVHLSRSLAG